MRRLLLLSLVVFLPATPASAITWLDVDTTPPVLVGVPSSFSVEATSAAGAVADYAPPSATDDQDPSPTVACTPGPGSTFPLGPTTVTCTATDASGNNASATFAVTVVDTTPPVLAGVPASTSVEATASTGAAFSYTAPTATDTVNPPAPSVGCAPGSGSTFPLGTNTVTCTATDASGNTATATFTVTVVDTTPPVLAGVPASTSVEATSPGGTIVNYTPLPTATDTVDPAPTVGCAPASGSAFPFGATSVTCTATDASGNTATATFTVTVVDTTAPVLGGVPASGSIEATSPAGTVITYPSPTATDNSDPAPTVDCTPASGGTFGLGPHTFSCTARDRSGNTSGAAVFTITVTDTTNPVLLGLPSSFSTEATSSAGAAVTYTPPTATDNADPAPSVGCAPASGSTFPLGSSTVTCEARDSSGHKAEGIFTITVRDTTAPVLSGVPPDRQVEANGPGGASATFGTPTAVDTVDGPIAGVTCVPASGSTFSLGSTSVNCRATDSRGNTGMASFRVNVVDTTPPNLTVPQPRSAYATTPDGLPKTDPAVFYFVTAASATDIADPHPSVTTNEPDFLPVGTSIISFIARDASGNATSKEVQFTVLPKPPEGTPPLPIPPAPTPPPEVQKLAAKPLNHGALITWQRPAGTKESIVTRFTSGTRVTSGVRDGQIVYRGAGTRFVDRGLQNGVEYRYVVVTVDEAGNQSAGVAIVVFPRRDLLRAPKEGARLKKAPRLVWTKDPRAAYYNLQLLRNGVKILSVWPTKPAFALHRTWKYQGRRYTLTAGTYEWYVWPGYGPRSEVNYGELLGGRSFTISR